MIDILYMWSAMLSGCCTPRLTHPVRGVVCGRAVGCSTEARKRELNNRSWQLQKPTDHLELLHDVEKVDGPRGARKGVGHFAASSILWKGAPRRRTCAARTATQFHTGLIYVLKKPIATLGDESCALEGCRRCCGVLRFELFGN